MRRYKGLSELAYEDWQRRLNDLTTLGNRTMLVHEVVNGKVDGKVPVEQLVERAERRGLITAFDGDRLFITRQKKVA